MTEFQQQLLHEIAVALADISVSLRLMLVAQAHGVGHIEFEKVAREEKRPELCHRHNPADARNW